MATYTFYPAAGTNSPVDGSVEVPSYGSATCQSFSSLINLSTGGTADPTGPVINFVYWDSRACTIDNFKWQCKFIPLFNTVSLTGENIISATLSLNGAIGDADCYGNQSLVVSAVTPASDANLVAADSYRTNWGSVAFSDSLAFSSWLTGYNTFTFNADGIAAVNKTGISKFGVRWSDDLSGTFSGTWTDGTMGIWGYTADNGSLQPKLTVITSVAAGFIPKIIMY